MATNSNPSSSSPSKTLDHEISPTKTQENPSSPWSIEPETKICGICSLEEGKSIKGSIDCCDHHFCFVCIMEWSSVDTHCPLCMYKFSTVRRPKIHGVFSSDRVIDVPVRKNDYSNNGITTISHSDPYSQFQCSVCHSMTDECLVILCRLCDWSAHTYCVGLGTTIPYDDWFCPDCALSKAESHVSVFDLVCEPIIPDEVEEPCTIASQHGDNLFISDELTDPTTRSNYNVADRTSSRSVKKLTGHQDVHSRIQALREHWDSLRGGHLSFSSPFVACSDKISMKLDNPSSSTSCNHLESQVSCDVGTLHDKRTRDIKKAWKLMDIAKSRNPTFKKSENHISQKYKRQKQVRVPGFREKRL